ncbi:MAG: F0F1 ATP synthase subunit delta [Burkholderiaceae bacterium]|nr:F0F1 ATP synthase subunit delta [Burkholderiaceae bacterium]
MELDWTTFALEIVNFLILVWILKRFLYRPVLDVIARRRAQVALTLADAHRRDDAARALQADYEARMAAWEGERSDALEKLGEEISAERARRLEQVAQAVEAEREKAEVLARRRTDEERRHAQAEAIEQGTRFAARLLERLAGPALETGIVDALIEDLAQLPPAQREALADAAGLPGARLRIASTATLDADARTRLSAAFESLLGCRLDEEATVSPELIAGLSVSIGPWVLAANLRDELAYFRAGARLAG